MKPTRVLLAAASSLFVSQLMAGEAVLYITEDGSAVRDLAVSVDGQKKLVGASGFVVFDIKKGDHKVELSKYGEWLGEFDFATAGSNQNAEVQVDMVGGEPMPEINIYTPGQEEAPAVGQISGYLQSDETGGPVSGARISVAGTEMAMMTDADGFFSFELPRGEYALNIAHPNYGKRDVSSVRVMSSVNTGINMTMSMSGDGMIEEVVAVGSYIPSTATAQQRDSSAVLNAIGTEQMARFGDSSAASALKRVAGVSVVGGQFAVVRGMQGRYISSTLNGSLMPSTDPMRRDVPLDLFPSSVLGGIEIQKTFTPDLPGDSTGGAIRMKTKEMPTDSAVKISASLALNDRTTFSDINGYEGGSTDWLGIDDGTREQPSFAENLTNGGLDNPRFGCAQSNCLPESEQVKLGQSFENNYNVDQVEARPDRGFSLSVSDFNETDYGANGSYFALQYKDEIEARHDARINDLGTVGSYERTKRKVDLTGYFVYGLEYGNSSYESKSVLLRKTDNTIRTQTVEDDGKNQEIASTTLQWVERQYLGQQFSGLHNFSLLGDDELSWRIGFAQSSRYEPDRRSYQYGRGLNTNQPLRLLGSVERRYSDLTENVYDLGVDYQSDIMLDDILFRLKTGLMYNVKDREVDLARYSNRAITDPAVDTSLTLEEILTAENIADRYVVFLGSTTDTDDYEATDETLAYYVSAELDLGSVSVLAGGRLESFSQEIKYPNQDSSNSKLDESKFLPALSAVWRMNDEAQIRASLSQTISKPGITERSQSAQYDPETDDLLVGNPNLIISEIMNADLRGEYYFSDDESISLAFFYKDVSDPIERSVVDGDGNAAEGYTFANAPGATLQGVEIDFRVNTFSGDVWSSFLGGNAAWVDSEVDLSGTDAERLEGTTKRKLQGQSEYLGNLQVGFDHLPTGQSVTLLLNYFDDRIYATSRGQLSEEVEDARVTIDLTYNYDVNEQLSVKAKASNLNDSKVSFSRGDDEIESYFEGRKYSASVEYIF